MTDINIYFQNLITLNNCAGCLNRCWKGAHMISHAKRMQYYRKATFSSNNTLQNWCHKKNASPNLRCRFEWWNRQLMSTKHINNVLNNGKWTYIYRLSSLFDLQGLVFAKRHFGMLTGGVRYKTTYSWPEDQRTGSTHWTTAKANTKHQEVSTMLFTIHCVNDKILLFLLIVLVTMIL